ncbi:MAG: hypothetical protein AAGE89_17870, partial [Pseudomonadota bacterium]
HLLVPVEPPMIETNNTPSVFDADCLVRRALELIASKWIMLVLVALARQAFGEREEDYPVRA